MSAAVALALLALVTARHVGFDCLQAHLALVELSCPIARAVRLVAALRVVRLRKTRLLPRRRLAVTRLLRGKQAAGVVERLFRSYAMGLVFSAAARLLPRTAPTGTALLK